MHAPDESTNGSPPDEESDGPVALDAVDLAWLLHALRNPLTAILIGSQHLAGLDLGKHPTATAARIAQSAAQLSQILDQLEQLSRLRVQGRP